MVQVGIQILVRWICCVRDGTGGGWERFIGGGSHTGTYVILTSLLLLDTGLALASATEARLYLLQRSSSGSTPASMADKNTLPNLQESLLQELELCPPSLPNIPSPAGGGQVGVITLEDVCPDMKAVEWERASPLFQSLLLAI